MRTLSALAENSRNVPTQRRRPLSTAASIDMVKREMSDIRFSQSETDRRTQDSLEAVHSTLGHVVDRLAMIEGDLRAVARSARRAAASRSAARTTPAPQPAPPQAARRHAMPPQPKPELPNPAAAHVHFATAPREFQAVQPPAPAAIATPRAISEILEPLHGAAAPGDRAGTAARSSARAGNAPDRAGGDAVGAHCRLRKRDQRNSRD